MILDCGSKVKQQPKVPSMCYVMGQNESDGCVPHDCVDGGMVPLEIHSQHISVKYPLKKEIQRRFLLY